MSNEGKKNNRIDVENGDEANVSRRTMLVKLGLLSAAAFIAPSALTISDAEASGGRKSKKSKKSKKTRKTRKTRRSPKTKKSRRSPKTRRSPKSRRSRKSRTARR